MWSLGTGRYDMFGRTNRAEAAQLLILTTSTNNSPAATPVRSGDL
jgi:hypothetical protein